MHELQRQAYLQAIGVDSYISRGQLPGAAVTRRIAVVRRNQQSALRPPAAATNSNTTATDANAAAPRSALPDFDFDADAGTARQASVVPVDHGGTADKAPAIRLRFATIVCGGYLWLEDLADRALASQQVALVQGMAQALAVACADANEAAGGTSPEIAQFDWPMHNNRQLDNSEQAARAGLAAFIGRRLEQNGCKALVVLGAACEPWVANADYTVPVVTTLSTSEMLAQPLRKADAWRDLVTLVART